MSLVQGRFKASLMRGSVDNSLVTFADFDAELLANIDQWAGNMCANIIRRCFLTTRLIAWFFLATLKFVVKHGRRAIAPWNLRGRGNVAVSLALPF
jgi:hypothetical protein